MKYQFQNVSRCITIALSVVSVLFIGSVNSAEDLDPNIAITSAVVTLTDSTFDEQITKANIASSTGRWFVKFYIPGCEDCKALAPIWDDLSEKIKITFPHLVIAEVDCAISESICTRLEVTEYPTLKYFTKGNVYEYKNEHTHKEFLKFAFTGHTKEASGVSTGTGTQSDVTSAVVTLTDSTFEEQLAKVYTASSTSKWFIKFYAPWCGHCKALAPKWDELSLKVQKEHPDIVIAKVDCTTSESICTRFGVRGYPTLSFFANGKVYEYEGKRSTEEFLKFVITGYKNEIGLSAGGVGKFIQDSIVDIYHILKEQTISGLILLVFGIISGVTIMVFLDTFLSSNGAATATTTDKGKHAKKE